MGKQSTDQIVTDPSIFTELSSSQRVLNVLRIAGHTDEQIANLTRRHSHLGVLINNLATCRDPKLRAECLKQKAVCEAELMEHLPPGSNRPWTALEELNLVIAVASEAMVPPLLRRTFAILNQLQADPV